VHARTPDKATHQQRRPTLEHADGEWRCGSGQIGGGAATLVRRLPALLLAVRGVSGRRARERGRGTGAGAPHARTGVHGAALWRDGKARAPVRLERVEQNQRRRARAAQGHARPRQDWVRDWGTFRVTARAIPKGHKKTW